MSTEQTLRSFGDKWNENPDLAFEQTLDETSSVFEWILKRNGFSDASALQEFLSEKSRILDAGCGNGRVTALLHRYAPNDAELVGIDLAASEVAESNTKALENVSIFNGDLLEDLSVHGKFDFIYCQEVLHHTADPRRAFLNLVSLLSPGGEIAIYVYRKKAPVREFTDDHLRAKIASLDYESAMTICRNIADVGKVLSDLDLQIQVPEIAEMGIEEGEYDLQRFFYHFFMKCFWNDEFDREANAAINFDWYSPQLCSRHVPEEIAGWFSDTDLEVTQQEVDHYGITMRGRSSAKS